MTHDIDLSSIKSSQVDHLPIISHYAGKMGFEKIINELVAASFTERWKRSQIKEKTAIDVNRGAL